MTDINETNDTDVLDETAVVGTEPVEPDDASETCPKAAHCPLKHHPGMCGKGGKCPVKNLSRNDVIAGAITLVSMIALTVAGYYAQFVLTKAAVKSALKETRLR
ncbi:hypothetical protein [Bifidobacterium miconisargentati]|uniref:hypothetical protein n=1 Tax=Bifidobacterium miconisargentati TaxID=2834437 RepID=UPI001BDCF33E|nr:hypothetical protein [Bifidobacterium miconisargentati]MBW3090624.1 hypothetical protein [Bifidobacterium miconisargentati]